MNKIIDNTINDPKNNHLVVYKVIVNEKEIQAHSFIPKEINAVEHLQVYYEEVNKALTKEIRETVKEEDLEETLKSNYINLNVESIKAYEIKEIEQWQKEENEIEKQ